MSEKKVGKRLLTWVLVLVMTLSLLPLNVLAANSGSGMNFTKELLPDAPDDDGNYTIQMTAQATGTSTTINKAVPMDIVLVLDQSGSMKEGFGNGTRQSAMKAAVNSFIDEVNKKYTPEADHRMAIVTFGSDAETLADWTHVDDSGKNNLTSAINTLPPKPKGATNVGAGMEKTAALMGDALPGEKRQKTVIVFTDGVPTKQSDFNTKVANTAISAAKSMKDGGVTIYTVGIFNGANPNQLYGKDQIGFAGRPEGECTGKKDSYWQYRKGVFSGGDIEEADIAAGNRFLNYLSSNYDASEIGIISGGYDGLFVDYRRFTITDDTAPGSNQGYYMTASNASSLENIFQEISDTIVTPDKDELNENTVITDTLSDYFTFAGTADDVKVYAGQRELTIGKDITVDLNPMTKTVTVKGYDFSAHHTKSSDPEKLVIKIKVKPDPTATWGESGEYETNEDYATVTLPGNQEPIAKAESPKVHVDTYQVTYKPGDGSGDAYTDQYYLNGATTTVLKNRFTAPEGYEFDCWKDKDGKSYQVNDEITFAESNVTLTAQWKKSKYKVTYALTDEVKPSRYSMPTDIGEYMMGDTYTVDSNYKKGSNVVEGGYTYTFSGWKLNGAGDVLTGDQTMGNENVVLKGTWTRTVNEYTLSYETNGGTIKENASCTEAGKVAFGTVLKTPAATDMTKEGYTFAGWYSDEDLTAPDTMPAHNLTLYAKWTANTDTHYTVEYYYQDADDSYPTTANETSDRTGTTGETAFVTADDKADKESGKYTYDTAAANKVESGTIAADGSLKLKLYFKLSKFDYTIEYYCDGENEPFDKKTVVNVTYGTIVSEVADSSELRAHYSREGVEPKLPVTIDEAGIVIKVTYTKDPVDNGTFDFNDVVHDDDKVTPAITKTVKGNVGKNFKETFAVTVKGADDMSKGTMATASYTGKAEVTYSDLKDIAFRFAENNKLTFRDSGDYSYTVREVPGKTSRMSYDTTKYTLTINVVLDEDANAYKVESWQFTAGNKEYPTALNIVNTYRTYHPSTPSKPTVEIPDDDALGLNTTDHFAYILGYGNGEVRPQNNITRAEVATIFFRLLTDDVRDANLSKTNRYTDVTRADWYNTAVSTLSSMGIITGYPDGTFRPNAAITRAEFAAIAARFDTNGDKTTAKFTDIASHWAKDEISIAANNGWIKGYEDNTFRPQRDITRAETMTLVNRVLNRQPETEDDLLPNMTVWTDNANPKAWYYLAVQEATNSHYYEFKTNSQYEKWTELRETRDWTQLEK